MAIHLGIVGDSGIDEYRADDNRGGAFAAVTFNPLEILVRVLGTNVINPGPWGTRPTPRRTGFEYNWALSGATAGSVHNGSPGHSIVDPDQVTGLAGQIADGLVDTAVIWAGANDYAIWNGTFDAVYYNWLSTAQRTEKINSILNNLTDAVDTFLAAGAARVLITNFIDLTVDPGIQWIRNDPVGRQRVSDDIAIVNAGIADLVASDSRLALIDRLNWTANFVSQYASQINFETGELTIAGEVIQPTSDDEPHHFLLGDGEHYGTIYSGILANLHIVDVLNSAFGLDLPRLTDEQIVAQIYPSSEVSGTALLTSTGSLTGAGILQIPGAADLTGIGVLDGKAQLVIPGAASLTGSSTIETVAVCVVTGKAGLVGSGDLTAMAVQVSQAAAALAGVGALSSKALVLVLGSAALVGVGSLEASGLAITAGKASLAGSGLLAADSLLIVQAAGQILAVNSLSAASLVLVMGKGALSGTGQLQARTGDMQTISGAALLTGAGAISAGGKVEVLDAADLVGGGELNASGLLILPGQASMAGMGWLQAGAMLFISGAVGLTATGELIARGRIGLLVAMTPKSRTYLIPAESRVAVLQSENRTDLILAENRTCLIRKSIY